MFVTPRMLAASLRVLGLEFGVEGPLGVKRDLKNL